LPTAARTRGLLISTSPTHCFSSGAHFCNRWRCIVVFDVRRGKCWTLRTPRQKGALRMLEQLSVILSVWKFAVDTILTTQSLFSLLCSHLFLCFDFAVASALPGFAFFSTSSSDRQTAVDFSSAVARGRNSGLLRAR
jgi:hypothetical protein